MKKKFSRPKFFLIFHNKNKVEASFHCNLEDVIWIENLRLELKIEMLMGRYLLACSLSVGDIPPGTSNR